MKIKLLATDTYYLQHKNHWFVVIVVVRVNSALMNLFLKNAVVLSAIYGCHTGRTYEFITHRMCTQYVSTTLW